MAYELYESTRQNKKYMIITPRGTAIHFGDSLYEDFTTHKDKNRRKNYLSRHQKRENWEDLKTPGFWSRWLLWNKPTLLESVEDIQKKYNITIIV